MMLPRHRSVQSVRNTVNGMDGEAQEPVTTDPKSSNASSQTRRDGLLQVPFRTDTGEMINEFTHKLQGVPVRFPIPVPVGHGRQRHESTSTTSMSKRGDVM